MGLKKKNMRRKIFYTIMVLIIGLGSFSPFAATEAIEFNRHLVISDDQMFNPSAMTLAEIQKFLELKNSYLATLTVPDIDGAQKTAAAIIDGAAKRHGVNPKLILVMLQKEQSLVEDPNPSYKQIDWAMGYGVCDSCSLNDPLLLIYKGFANQVDKAIARLRWYSDNPTVFKTVGQTYIIDGQDVTPMTQATANLYSYTPHIHGNYLFWKIWQRWFKQYYPDGSLLKTYDAPTVWLIQFGEKRAFVNMSSLISRYDPKRILTVTTEELDKYEVGAPIKYPNYSLLKEPTGSIYLLVGDTLKHIDTMDTFRLLGFNPLEIIEVETGDLDGYNIGEEITMKSSYPLGALLQNKDTGGVYYVQNGVKHPLIAIEIMRINYPGYRLIPVDAVELENFDDGDMIGYREGALLKGSDKPTVYVVSGATRRPIVSGEVFERLGYKWTDVYTVSEGSLVVLPLGQSVDLSFKE
ncbi:TPA: hypothetical protein DF272_03620 [Candidatus Falkowbacteria bacterium]|nr:hypothetical protein [Candidatus Falkowbacteria bacterium]